MCQNVHGNNYLHYTYLVTAVSFRIEDIKVFWKLYIDAKFYADHEYAIYFIPKVNFTKVIHYRKPHECTAIRVHSDKGIIHKTSRYALI